MARNALADRASVSIHVYGANIGVTARHRYDERDGQAARFIGAYANDVLPNLWRAMPK